MGNLKRLLEKYENMPQTLKIIEHLEAKKAPRLQLTGSVGAQDSFVLSAIFQKSNHSQIYIASDKDEAAYVQNSLDQIIESQSVLFFPDSFKHPGRFDEISNNNVLIRTEAINKISNKLHKKEILVTYPEAIFEKVVDPIYLESQKISISKEESLDVDTIIELMVEYGFERVDFVYEPGQFSIRGGIIDIFSYGNEWPYRVELFDDEVESIRTFNPTTQLSLKNILKVSIIPNINNKFDQTQKVSIFKVFKENTLVWVKDLDMLVEKLAVCMEATANFAKELSVQEDEELKKILNSRSFIKADEVLTEIDSYAIALQNKSAISVKIDEEIKFNVKPQPNFNKNFNFLIEDLTKKGEEKYESYLFTENNRQIERFYNIFEDLKAEVELHPIMHALHAGFIDEDLKIQCYTDHQIFQRFHRYKLRKGFTKEQAMSLKMLRELQPGDFVTHIDHGVGRYSGLEKIDINGHKQESLRLFYQNNDVLYVSISSLHKISKYVGKDGTPPKLSKIGGDAWKTLKRKTKKQVKDIAKDLIKLYAKRKAAKGHPFPPDGYLQNELEASFIYEDTPDQYEASEAVKQDMQKEYPMDRLICGDVGFGKTEVAIRAAFKAVIGGKQVAILVPTTILAMQHNKTLNERLKEFDLSIDYVNRFKTAKQKREIYEKLSEGKIDIIIGTHALLNKDVKFKDLGLLVIDEEQKFGVAAKEKLRNIKVNVDTLTLTATPIPRTLQFSLMAARDLSVMRTPPPNRQPIHTERRVFNDKLIRESIYFETNRGGQVFFVHNRVKSLPDILAMISRLCPDVEVAMAHGQMESKQLETRLVDFIEGKFDVLVCTNIIETGLDIPNANTIIINNAHHFGMSDLHQLRGRVGRSNKKAFCYLFAPPLSTMTGDARKRLQTLEEFSDLGSGFHIAMKDLDIRGSGNLLGSEQSGFISDIGYETYQKILEEAIHELKETEFKTLFKEDLEEKKEFVREVEIDTDIEMLIPDDYISNIQERLGIYTSLSNLKKEEEIEPFKQSIKDRFGPIPRQVEELFKGINMRSMGKVLGFERISLKGRKLRCYFISNAQSAYFETKLFENILAYISTNEKMGLSLKQTQKSLLVVKDGVKSLKEASIILQRMKEDLIPQEKKKA